MKSAVFLLVSVFHGIVTFAQLQPAQPTRNPDVWNIFGETSTVATQRLADDPANIIISLSLGKVVGRSVPISNLSWTLARDQRDRPAPGTPAWLPLPLNNTVDVFVFLGVPYAEKPIGERRFKPPQKLTRFGDSDQGVVRAFKYSSACVQDIDRRPTLGWHVPYEYNTDEDCLYLNIFSPQIESNAAQPANYPVVVFLHGGAFQWGSGADWPGHVLASRGLVVVTLNYRLGALGFMSTGAAGSGANNGLLDQHAALEFVRDHIYAFGGDASRVTLVGHGAGAVSAGLHMLSPMSKNLFHAVGAMSGADVSYWQVITRPDLAYNNTRKLGLQLGCSLTTIDEIYACIQTRSSRDILQGMSSMMVEYNRYAFLPLVDGRFITGKPETLLRTMDVANPVPYMTGVNGNDGTAILLSERDLAEFTRFEIEQAFMDDRILDYTLKRNYTENRHAVIEAIKYRYTYWPDTLSDYHVRKQYIEFASDAYYAAPVTLSARLHSTAGSFTYMYVNNYNISTGALSQSTHWLPYWMGVCHECDLYLLFGMPWAPTNLLPIDVRNATWTLPDRNASELFMTLWQRFASDKNPNIRHDEQNMIWPNMNTREWWYLNFNYTSTGDARTVERNYRWAFVSFWNEYMDRLADFYTTSFSPTVASLRRELVGYKAATGVFVGLFLLIVILSLVFAYQIFERKNKNALRQSAAPRASVRANHDFIRTPGLVDTSLPVLAHMQTSPLTPAANHASGAGVDQSPLSFSNDIYGAAPQLPPARVNGAVANKLRHSDRYPRNKHPQRLTNL